MDANIIKTGYNMVYPPCGGSFDWNMKYKMYYNPNDSGNSAYAVKKPVRYLGIYRNKKISGMGKIENCVACNYNLETNELKIIESSFEVTERQKERLLEAIPKNPHGKGVFRGHKFFLLDENDFTDELDNFHKASRGGIFQKLNVDLKAICGDLSSISDGSSKKIAKLLVNKSFHPINSVDIDGNKAIITEMEKEEMLGQLKTLLKANHNLVLTGAPGTGKTYLAKEIAEAMGATTEGVICEFVQFHASYDYRDFVEGLHPTLTNGQAGFELKDGIFKEFLRHF